MKRSGLLMPVLVILFLISGACGLIYQVLWLRMLGLVFGVTVYSASTVWASFMTGLAVGSFIGGRIGDRARSPLLWFGVAEILVGVSALATPIGLDLLQRLYAWAWPSLPQSVAAVTVARAAMSFAVLVIPTVLMGATLPLVVRSSLVRRADLGARVGLLYGTNTTGAIVGTLAAGLYLIPTLGIQHTFQVAAALNVTVGLAAILLGRETRRLADEPVAEPSASADTAPAPLLAVSRGTRRLVLAVFVLSGFATLALEVVWFRTIVLVARPTVYTFAVMLATVLAGIAAGSYLITPWMRRRWNWVGVLAAIEIALAGAALWSLGMLARVTDVNAAIAPYVSGFLPSQLTFALAAALPAILPASVLMGMGFPIGLRLWVADEATGAAAASRIGVFNSLNLIGAIFGSLAGGFLLLPSLGSRRSLIVIAALIFASGCALIVAAVRRPIPRLLWAGALTAVFVLAAVRTPDPFDLFLSVRYPKEPVAWREEAVDATVSILGNHEGGYIMVLNGNHQANDTPAMLSYHRRIAELPLAVHPDAKEVLVVGLGGGATAGAISFLEGVRLDIVELSPAVVRASRFFANANHQVLSRPNVHLYIDDGRNFLALRNKKYDVITADIIEPLHAGSNNVYSREYFQLVRAALKPGGMAMQWAWGTAAEHKTIARTFQSVFPYTTTWADGSLLLGSLEPLVLRQSDFDRKFAFPGHRLALEELGVRSFKDLLAMYTGGPDELRNYTGPGAMLTDDRPLAEYFLSLPRGTTPDITTLKGDVQRHVK